MVSCEQVQYPTGMWMRVHSELQLLFVSTLNLQFMVVDLGGFCPLFDHLIAPQVSLP